jgi:resuscitation-promoting factor RpfA
VQEAQNPSSPHLSNGELPQSASTVHVTGVPVDELVPLPPAPPVVLVPPWPLLPAELPAAPDELPAAPDELPAAPDELPAAPDELPAAPDELPAAPDELPALAPAPDEELLAP